MSRIVDNLIAFRILSMLVKPFRETEAFALGLIDEDGVALKKVAVMSEKEKSAYTYLHRLAFNMKRIIGKIPGGSSKLGSLAAAMFLIKEAYESGKEEILAEDYHTLIGSNVILVEETIFTEEFLECMSEDIANVTGGATSTDIPVIRLSNGRRMGAFAVGTEIFKRFDPDKKKYAKWANYLNLENEHERGIYDYVRKNPKGILVLRNGKDIKVIKS